MPSVRARVLRRSLAVALRAGRRLRGGLPSPDAPSAELEAYVLAARDQLTALAARLPTPRDVDVEVVPAAPARVRAVVVTPRTTLDGVTPRRTVLYIHGGAYCLGSPELFLGLAANLARGVQARVVVPDYRLAPESPFPAALDDVTAWWSHLLARGARAAETALVGDSAGGGLAAALCLRLRDRGDAVPACLVGLSPWTDLAATGGSLEANVATDLLIPGDLVAVAARAYAGGTPLDDPLASPARAELTGLPPTLVHVSDDEVLFDDAERFVAAARAVGVDASLGRFEGLWHVFHAFPNVPESRFAMREIAAFIRRHTTPGQGSGRVSRRGLAAEGATR